MILIIAYGNSLRRDDGAGLILAEKLEQECRAQGIDVERIVAHQLTPELSLEVARADVSGVAFVDARTIGPGEANPQVQIYPVEADLPSPSLGHHLNAASLLVYARLLSDQTPPAWAVTVPGVDFGHGERLSEITQKALAAAREKLVDLAAELAGAEIDQNLVRVLS